ncbi:MAG: hypothetical protein AB7P04_08680 [Bacteriovoracia bacterium]
MLTVLSYQEARIAQHKPFWQDEGFEIYDTCAYPYSKFFVRGAPNACNVPPLHHIIQRAVSHGTRDFDDSILLTYRIEPLAAGFVAMASVVYVGATLLGWSYGLFALALVGQRMIFHFYTTETRPYSLWMGFFMLVVALTVRLSRKSWGEITRGDKLWFAGASFLLTFTSNPGWMQVGVCCFVLGMLSLVMDGSGGRKAFRYFGISGAIFAAIGLFYSRHAGFCAGSAAGPLNWDQIHSVRSLLWQDGLFAMPFNLLLVAGMAYVCVLFRRRSSWNARERQLFALGALSWFFIGVFAATAVAVILYKYHFIQRMFLYLVFVRAFFVLLGLYGVVELVRARVSHPLLLRGAQALAIVGLLAYCGRILHRTHEYAGEFVMKYEATASPAGKACLPWSGELRPYVFTGREYGWEQPMNIVVDLGRELKRCGWPAAEPGKVQYITQLNGEFAISDQPPTNGMVPVRHCGLEVRLKPDL